MRAAAISDITFQPIAGRLRRPGPTWEFAIATGGTAAKFSDAPEPAPSFDQMLRSAGARDREALKDAAVKLVSSALVLPALASLHESPLQAKTGPFAPGTAEKRFAPLLDQQLADRITQAANFSLIDSIVDRFARRVETKSDGR